MPDDLEEDGFAMHRGIVSQVRPLIDEAESLVKAAGRACVRDVHRSPCFLKLAERSQLAGLLPDGLAPVRIILFDKTPEENWPVGWHQDLSIAVAGRCEVKGYQAWTRKNGVPHVRPPIDLLENMITARLHLDDVPPSNGALRVVPGSHQLGQVPSEQVMAEVRERGEVICACAAGDVLLMKPLLLHASSRAENGALHRRVIHIEYARRELLDLRLEWHLGAAAC